MMTFAERLAELDARKRAERPTSPITPGDLPTEYGQLAAPQGVMRDADTFTRPSGEVFRGYGVNAAELQDKKTGQLIPEGQEAYARAAQLFAQNPNTTPVRYGQDKYGRTVADEITPEGRSVYGQMVEQGVAPSTNYNKAPVTPFGAESRRRYNQLSEPDYRERAVAAYQGRAPQVDIPEPVVFDLKNRTAGEALKSSVARGLEGMTAGAYGTVSAVGDLLADNAGTREPRNLPEDQLTLRDRITNWLQRTGEAGYMEHDAKARAIPKVGTLEDAWEGKVNALQWGLETLGEAVPSTLAMLGTAVATSGIGTVAGLAARGVGTAALGNLAARAGVAGAAEATGAGMLRGLAIKQAERTLAAQAAKSLGAAGVNASPGLIHAAATRVAANPEAWLRRMYASRAALPGAWLGSTTLEAGHIYEDTKQAYGPEQVSPGLSLAGGAVAGLLDTAALHYAVAPLAKLLGGATEEAATGAAKSLVGEVAKRVLGGMGTEGSTEAMQEIVAVATQELQNPDQSVPLLDRLTTPENLTRYLEAGVAGMIFGGVFAAPGGAASYLSQPRQPTATPEAAPPVPELTSNISPPPESPPAFESSPLPPTAGAPGATTAPNVAGTVPSASTPNLSGESIAQPGETTDGQETPAGQRTTLQDTGIQTGTPGSQGPGRVGGVDRQESPSENLPKNGSGWQKSGSEESELLISSIANRLVVKPGMLRSIDNPKVLDSVISRVPVDVVNNFGGKENTSQVLLQYPSVFSDALSININGRMTLTEPAIQAFRNRIASARTEILQNAGLGNVLDTTGQTGISNAPGSLSGIVTGDRAKLGATAPTPVNQKLLSALDTFDRNLGIIAGNLPPQSGMNTPPGTAGEVVSNAGRPPLEGLTTNRADIGIHGATVPGKSDRFKQPIQNQPTAPTAPTTPFDIDDATVRTETINRLTPKEIEDLAERQVFSNAVNGVPQGPRQGWGAKPGWLNDQQWEAFKRLNVRHLAAAWNATIREPVPGATPDPQTGRIKHRDTGVPLLSDAMKAELSKIIRPSLLQSLDALGARFFSGPESQDIHASGFARALVGEKKAKGAGTTRGTRWGEEWPTLQKITGVLAQLSTAAPAAFTPAAPTPAAPTPAAPAGTTIVGTNQKYDVLAMRVNNGRSHMYNTEPGKPGWLGNPVKWAGNGGPKDVTVEQAIRKFKQLFEVKIASDPIFRRAIEGLRGKRIGYYAPNQPNHVQVIVDWLNNTPAAAELEREYLDQNGIPVRAPTLEPVTAPTPAAPTPAAPTPAAPQRVYTTADVSKGHAKAKAFVDDLTRLLGLPKLTVTSAPTEAMKARGVGSGVAALDSEVSTVWVNPGFLGVLGERAKPDDQTLAAHQTILYTSIAHEVGHWLDVKAWKDASSEVRKAIDAAYAAWYKAQKGRDPAAIIASSEVVRLRKPVEMSEATKARLMQVDEGQTEPYILSKREWLADQVAGVLVNDPQVLAFLEKQQPLVRRWINRLVARFKQLYQRIQALTQGEGSLLRARTPNAAVARFVMEAAERNRHRWAETQGWFPEVTATLQSLLYAVGEKDFAKQVQNARRLMEAPVVSKEARAVYNRWLTALEQADAAARKLPDEVTRTKLVSQIIAQGRLALDQQYSWFSLRRHTELAKFGEVTAQQLKAAWGAQAPELANALTDLIGAATIAKTFGTAVGYQQERQAEQSRLGEKAKQELNDLLGATPGLTQLHRKWMNELNKLLATAKNFTEISKQFQAFVDADKIATRDQKDSIRTLLNSTIFKDAWEQWRALERAEPNSLDQNWLQAWKRAFGIDNIPIAASAIEGNDIVVHPFETAAGDEGFRGDYAWLNSGLYYDDPDTLTRQFGHFLIKNGLFHDLPANYRDGLVEAYQRSPHEVDSITEWLGEEIAKALRTNPVILQILTNQNQGAFNKDLYRAIIAKPEDRANRMVNLALEKMLATNLGNGVVSRARKVVGHNLSGATPEFLPFLQMRALGADGKYAVVKRVLAALARVDDRQNLEDVMQELADDRDVIPEDLKAARLAYQDLLGERVPSERFLQTLVNLYEALQRKESNELTVDDLLREQRSQESAKETDEESMPETDYDGGFLDTYEQYELTDDSITDTLRYDDDLETQERPEILTHILALRSTFFSTAGKNTREKAGQVYSHVEATPVSDELDPGSLLNAGGTRSLDVGDAKMGVKFAAEYGNTIFGALPVAMQHTLVTRTLMLNQSGIDVKFELGKHKTPDGREIIYVKETAKPGTDADLVQMEGGLSRATLDSLATLVEERRRSASRMSELSKRNSGVVFSAGANLKHPLIQRMANAVNQALSDLDLTVEDLRKRDWSNLEVRRQIRALVSKVDEALGQDRVFNSGRSGLEREKIKDFGRSVLAAMGFDNAVFFEGKAQVEINGRLENYDSPIVQKYLLNEAKRAELLKDPSRLVTQGRGMVIVHKALAEQMGVPLYVYKGKDQDYHAVNVNDFNGIIDLFVRAYLKYHENDASHLTTGASAELTLDDVVKVGYTAMRGLDAVSGTHMDRIAALVKGFEVLRTKLAHSLRPMPTETHTQLVDKKDAKNQPVYLRNLDGSIRKDKDDKPVPAKMWKYQTTDGIKTDLSLVDFDNLSENSPLRGWILEYDPKTREFVTVGDVLGVKGSIKGLIKEIATLQNEAAVLTEDLSELERQFQKTIRRRQEASDREAMGFPAKEDDAFLLNNPDVLARFVGKLRNVFLNRNAKLRLARGKIAEVREVHQDRTLRDDNALNDSEAVLDLLERAGIKDPAWDRSAADDQRLYGEEWRQIEYRVQKTPKELERLSGERPQRDIEGLGKLPEAAPRVRTSVPLTGLLPGETTPWSTQSQGDLFTGKAARERVQPEGSEVAARPPEVKSGFTHQYQIENGKLKETYASPKGEAKTVTPEQREEAVAAKEKAEQRSQDWLNDSPYIPELEWFKVKQKPLPTAQPVSANEFTAEQTAELRGEFNWMMSELGISTAVLQHIDLLRMARERGKMPTFRQLLDELALTEQADEIVAMAQDDPYFTVYKDGVPHVYLITQGEDYDTVRGKLAHEMGHVFYRANLSDLKKATGGKQATVWKQLVKEATGGKPSVVTDDLMVDEYVASRMQRILLGLDKPVEVKSPPMVRNFIQHLLDRLKGFYDRLFGTTGRAKTEDSKQFVDNFLSGVLATIQYRNAVMRQNGVLSDLKEGMETLLNAQPDYSPGIRYYAGQKLLESTRAGKFTADRARGVWRHAKSLHHHITKTLDARLRSELDPNGKPLAALTALADLIVRAPGAAAPAPYTYRDMTIDFARKASYFEGFRPAWLRQAAGKALWVNEAFDNLTDAQKQDLMRRYVVARDTNQLATAPVEVKNMAKLFERLKDYYKDVLNSHVGSQSTELPRIWNKDALTTNKQDFLDLLTIKYAWKVPEAEDAYNHLLTEVSLYRGEDYSFYAPHLALARLNSDLASVKDIDLLPFLRVTTEPEATMKEYATQLIKRVEFERRFAAWVIVPTGGNVDYSLQGSVPALHDPAKHGNLYWDSNENSWMSQKGVDKFKVRWDQTVKLRILYNAALAEGATPSQLRFMIKAMDAVLGRAGADFDPNLRRLSSLIVTGMNWALLPLAVTTNLAGLAVPAIRANGAMGASWRGLTTALGEMRKKGELYQIATANGVVMDNLRGLYGRAYLDTPFMDQTFRKLNDTFFRYNGMEWLDNLTRLTAFATGIEWFKGLATKPGAESDALLKQLGLTHADLTKWLDPNGLNGKLTAPPPDPTHAPQQKAEQEAQKTTAYKIQVALNQFVAESAMHPDATQRPLWASHPAAMVVWHLKSFLWSYGHVVMGRMAREYQRADSYGKKVLILALPWALMVPLAMLGTVVREEIRDGLWGKPARREKEPEDYAMDILSRTGLLGPLQLALDANRSAGYGTPVYTALLGPFATSMDQMIRKIGGAGEGRLAQETTDALLRVSPIIGSLPDTRRALLEQMFR